MKIETKTAAENSLNFSRFSGAILGLAAGDALGVPAEFMSREELRRNPVTGMRSGGVHGQFPGTWSDDTGMTLCAMDSLTEKGVDYTDLMNRFADWLWNAGNTARGEVFDVGGTTQRAIYKFVHDIPPLECGETADYSCGNGSLMRILPAALYLFGKFPQAALNEQTAPVIHNFSKCTHAHPRCQMACGIYCAVVFELARKNTRSLSDAVQSGIAAALTYYREIPAFETVFEDFASLPSLGTWNEDRISGSGYVLHTVQAALWCLLTAGSYRDCVCKAVNLGEDTDTTAAVAGALAGLWYGAEAIPPEWLAVLAGRERIEQKIRDFFAVC